MSRRIYYVTVEEHELQNVEKLVYDMVLGQIREEIRKFANETAINILSGKPIVKKKWYQTAKSKIKDK